MRRHLIRDISQSIAAGAVLLALVIALPIGLTAARGWPLPSEVPSLESIRNAFGGASISDAALLNALACLAWMAWALVLWCVIVELTAWARGRAASAVPGAGAMQLLVRHLVVSATLLASAARTSSLVPSVAMPAQVLAVAATATSGPSVPAGDAEQPALPTCIVQPRDSLWRVAERHLGDPFRWREIYELNRGRTFVDGDTLLDADLIRPGWVLRLPADAVGADPAPVPQPDGVMEPVWTAAPTPAVTAPRSEAAPTPADDTPGVDVVDHADDDEPSVPAPLVASTLLLAGVVSTIAGLRRRQRRLREPGRSIRLPDDSVLTRERLIRSAADLDGAERLDLALRVLATQVVDPPLIDAVRVDGDEIEVLFAADAEGSTGHFAGVGTRAWTLPASVPTAELAACADRGCVVPSLVCVGRSDAGDVLIDLEAGSPLTVHGTPAEVEAVLRSMILDLATHRWADDVRVVVHGVECGNAAVLERVEIAHDLDAVTAEIEAESDAIHAAVHAAGAASVWHARVEGVGDGWAPTIVVLGTNAEAIAAARTVERLGDRTGIAVVRASVEEPPLDRERRLIVSTGCEKVALLPLDIVLESVVPPADITEAVDELVSVAAAAEPGERIADDVPVIDLRVSSHEVSPQRVVVRVLGRVEIDGGRSAIDRRRVVEFVTLLALHPRGLTENQIKAALWTDHEPTTNAFNQVVSRARTALGLDSSGQPHVRYVEDCVYRPGPELVTDWSMLEVSWRRAQRESSPEAVESLRNALDDVRGGPFEGTKGYEWAYELGLPSRIDAVIDEARHLIESSGMQRAAG
jgi:hypothetical protein